MHVKSGLRRWWTAAMLVAGGLGAGVGAAAQQVAVPVPVPDAGSTADEPLQVTSRLVVLDVVVVDAAGKFVDHLDRSKFHVSDDRVEQRVRNFDPPSMHAMPPGGVALVHSSADLGRIGNAPVNILVIDELNTPYMQIAYAQHMMERYLKAQPEVLPVPTLFLAAGASHIAVLHDYTQSRAELLESVKQHVTEADFEVLTASLNNGRKGAVGGMGRTLGTLAQIATGMRGFPGRKNLIWVGTGYKRSQDAVETTASDDNRIRRVVRTVTNRMLAAHMTMYLIDPEGPAFHSDVTAPAGSELDGSFGSVANEPNMSFESFARSTGGRVLFGRNDVETEVQETTTEGAKYYTLAYAPSGMYDKGHPYHALRVTVDGPGLRVITRDGYFGGTEAVQKLAPNTEKRQPVQVRFDLLNAARTTMVYTGLHSEAVAEKDGYSLQVIGNDLHWSPQPDGSRRSEITVLAVCYSAKDKELGQHAAELTDELEAKDRLGPATRVAFRFPMAVPAGTTRVRFVLRDAETGTMGSASAVVGAAVAKR